MAAELCRVHDAVKHHQSYKNIDYGVKVDKGIHWLIGSEKHNVWKLKEKLFANVQMHTEYIKEYSVPFSAGSNNIATNFLLILS